MTGTPKTLIAAIKNANEDGHTEYEVKKHVKDFLSQHFSVAMMKNPEAEEALMELFNRITKE